jgi:hypothetical protein
LGLGALAIRSRADRETLFVYNAISGDASLVRGLGRERAQVTALPGMKLGRWNVRIGVLDDQLLTLDTESRRIHAISLAALRKQPLTSVLHTTPLHAAAVPYRAVIHGDRVWVDYFATNRIEAYAWQRAARALVYLGEQIVPNARPLGLSDLWVRGDQLLVAASGISCLARLCPRETAPDPHVFAFALDHAPLGAMLSDLHPSNTNAAGLYLHLPTGTAFVINAGDYRDGYSSIQRIDANKLGREVRLARNAGAARGFALDARSALILQFSGEHAIVFDVVEERVLAILRFDGNAFAPLASLGDPLAERFKSDLQDVLPDPAVKGRFFIVDSKREQLLHVAFHAPSALELLGVTSLKTAAFRSAPSWAVWLGPG